MQTIYLDISNKGVYPCIYAKQGDVDRKFMLIVTDSGVPINCENTAISVWYDGNSGEGNYTHIGEENAISVTGNKITVSLIQQMLVNAGNGVLSVSVSDASGSQIGLWNIDYCVEHKPGAESEEATQYYDAFSQTASDIAKSAEVIGKTQERIDAIIKSKNATAAGLIYPLASANVPSGFLLCDGAEYSRTEYAELFEAISTIYGEGDGETTFNVPNLSTRVPVGVGDGYGLGDIGGEAEHTLTVDQMPKHSHTTKFDAPNKAIGSSEGVEEADQSIYFAPGVLIEGGRAGTLFAAEEGGNQPYSIMQPYTVVNYIISTGKEIEFVVSGSSGTGCASDAELIGIRVGYDGTVYETAGEAVRTQTGNNQKCIRALLMDGTPLLFGSDTKYYIKHETGVPTPTGNYFGTYAFINPQFKYISAFVACGDSVPAAISFYSDYKGDSFDAGQLSADNYMAADSVQFKSDSTNGAWHSAFVPDGCKVVVVCTRTDATGFEPKILVDPVVERIETHDLILHRTGLVDYGDLKQGAYDGDNNKGWALNGKGDRLSTGIIPRISCNLSATCDFENGYSVAVLAFKGTAKIHDTGWQTSAINISFADCDGFAISLKREVDGKVQQITPSSVTGLTIEEDSYIKIADPYKTTILEEKVKQLTTSLAALQTSSAKLPNPFIHKKYYSHLFIDKINADDNIVIPCQSVYDIDVASRLGFTVIEGNVQKTATAGKYVVMHGSSGYLGEQVVAVNDTVADPSTVKFANLSFDDIRNNYVYRSKYAKYQTKIISLEEFLLECKKRSIIPFVSYVDDTMLEITKSIVGNEFILYNGLRDKFDGMIYAWGSSSATKDDILAVCDSIGAPMMYGLNGTSRFTDEELTDIIAEVHKRGCLIGWAGCYSSITQNSRALNLGLDFSGTACEVDDFESGNLLNAKGDMDFSDFATTGTVANGVLTLATGDTVTVENLNQKFLAKGVLKIMFKGTISIDMGYKIKPLENGYERRFTSDGTTTLQFSTYFMEEVPTFTITAHSATTIAKVDYKVSKC